MLVDCRARTNGLGHPMSHSLISHPVPSSKSLLWMGAKLSASPGGHLTAPFGSACCFFLQSQPVITWRHHTGTNTCTSQRLFPLKCANPSAPFLCSWQTPSESGELLGLWETSMNTPPWPTPPQARHSECDVLIAWSTTSSTYLWCSQLISVKASTEKRDTHPDTYVSEVYSVH